MKPKIGKCVVLALIAVMVFASTGLAKSTGYFYIFAYSMRQKAAVHTPVFTLKVSGKSYNEHEFTADVQLIMQLESEFAQYLNRTRAGGSDFTVSARGAYKTQAYATERLNAEKTEWQTKGFALNPAKGFNFSGR